MKNLAEYLLLQLVDDKEAVTVTESEAENGSLVLTLRVAQEDMGRIIGKEGKIIRSIRDVIKILALKQNKHVEVILAE